MADAEQQTTVYYAKQMSLQDAEAASRKATEEALAQLAAMLQAHPELAEKLKGSSKRKEAKEKDPNKPRKSIFQRMKRKLQKMSDARKEKAKLKKIQALQKEMERLEQLLTEKKRKLELHGTVAPASAPAEQENAAPKVASADATPQRQKAAGAAIAAAPPPPPPPPPPPAPFVLLPTPSVSALAAAVAASSVPTSAGVPPPPPPPPGSLLMSTPLRKVRPAASTEEGPSGTAPSLQGSGAVAGTPGSQMKLRSSSAINTSGSFMSPSAHVSIGDLIKGSGGVHSLRKTNVDRSPGGTPLVSKDRKRSRPPCDEMDEIVAAIRNRFASILNNESGSESEDESEGSWREDA